MRLGGRVWKDGRTWLIEVPLLDVMTQGRSRKDALVMIADAIEVLVNEAGFKVDVYAGRADRFEIGSANVGALVALMLRRQRESHGLSLAEVATRMKQASKNAYARYEQGRATPTLEKLNELLAAVSTKRDLVLTESTVE